MQKDKSSFRITLATVPISYQMLGMPPARVNVLTDTNSLPAHH